MPPPRRCVGSIKKPPRCSRSSAKRWRANSRTSRTRRRKRRRARPPRSSPWPRRHRKTHRTARSHPRRRETSRISPNRATRRQRRRNHRHHRRASKQKARNKLSRNTIHPPLPPRRRNHRRQRRGKTARTRSIACVKRCATRPGSCARIQPPILNRQSANPPARGKTRIALPIKGIQRRHLPLRVPRHHPRKISLRRQSRNRTPGRHQQIPPANPLTSRPRRPSRTRSKRAQRAKRKAHQPSVTHSIRRARKCPIRRPSVASRKSCATRSPHQRMPKDNHSDCAISRAGCRSNPRPSSSRNSSASRSKSRAIPGRMALRRPIKAAPTDRKQEISHNPIQPNAHQKARRHPRTRPAMLRIAGSTLAAPPMETLRPHPRAKATRAPAPRPAPPPMAFAQRCSMERPRRRAHHRIAPSMRVRRRARRTSA